MSKYLIRRPGFGVLCKPPRPGMSVFWETSTAVAQLQFPWLTGVMLFDSEDGALSAAETYNGIATPVTDVFDPSVKLTPP